MFNYNNPYYNNMVQQVSGYNLRPVARFEETEQFYPDLQGNPMFFFDHSRNEIFVKQRNIKTKEIEVLRYTLSHEPISNTKNENDSHSQEISTLKNQIEKLTAIVSNFVQKNEVSANEQQS